MRSAFILSTLLFLTLPSSFSLRAQQELQINFEASESTLWTKYKYNNKPKDSLQAIRVLNELVRKFHQQGYLLATYSNLESNDVFATDFSIGPRFDWLVLNLSTIDDFLLRKARLKPKDFTNKPINPELLNLLENGLIGIAENEGFPFAKLDYDSLTINKNLLSANVSLELGPEIKFDSVFVRNNRPIKSKFISAYLGIRKGQPYSQELVEGAVRKLSRLPYVKLKNEPELIFSNYDGQLSLEFEQRPVNTLDGVIGFLPNTSRNNGLLITGQVDLELFNPFYTGKHIGLHWRRLSEETQRIQAEYEHPNLFSTPLSFSSNFNFLKQDTTFTRRDLSLDFSYNVGLNSTFTFTSNFTGTDLLAPSRFQNVQSLPEIADYDLNSYGLNFELDNLDDPVLPNSGIAVSLSGILGTKKIRPNSDLPNELYQGIDLNSTQYQFDLNANFYLAVSQKINLYTGLTAGLVSNDRLFLNDAYRLGGLNTIRGFAESVFFATSYAYSNIEGRLFFDSRSYLSAFIDLATIEGDFVDNFSSDNLLGFGFGINFSTSTGIFNFVYALGTSKETGPINFNQSNIHFGYTTRF